MGILHLNDGTHVQGQVVVSLCDKEAPNIVSSQFLPDFENWHHNAVDKFTILYFAFLGVILFFRYSEVSWDDRLALYCL